MKFLFQCILSFFVITFYVSGEKDEKRLLLITPDVGQDRLNRLENQLASLNSAVQQQSQTIQQQALTVQQQGAVIQQQGTTIQQQSTTIQLQGTEIKQLQYAKGNCCTQNITHTHIGI